MIRHRKHPRIKVELNVRLRDANEKEHHLLTDDISSQGVFLKSDETFAMGEEVDLVLHHGDGEMACKAHIVNIRPEGYGLKFIAPDNAFRDWMDHTITDIIADGVGVSDRRGSPRGDTAIPMFWRTNGVQREGILENLSFDGAFIASKEVPQMEESIEIFLPQSLITDDGSAREGCYGSKAIVTHVQAEGFGICFNEPNAEFAGAVTSILVIEAVPD